VYKVFFVDDEASMRAGIRDSVDWDNSGFALAGEAPDGEMALWLMQEILPDILITDVRMPFMDGIELSRRAKKIMPWIKIVILSGHDEFEYAKQAIAIGVEDYLLKPVTSGKLMETLNEIAGMIDEEKEKLRNVEELIEGTRKVKTERLLSDILYGGIDADSALAMAKELDIPVIGNYYLVMHIEIRRSFDESENYFYHAGECVQGVLNDWENALYLNQGADRIVCVLKGNDPASLEEDAYTCAHAVKYEVERNGPCFAAVAIGSIVTDIKDWPKSLADADTARRYLNLTNRNSIVSVQDVSASLSSILEKVIEIRDAAAGSKYNEIITKAQDYIRENYADKDISLHTVAKAVNISPNHFSTIFSQETGETFINYITKIRVTRAKELLKTTQIRTSDVGYEVGYNDTHYFSYVFKKNTGMTPKEFRNS
jgi:two-component system response regulator YesN